MVDFTLNFLLEQAYVNGKAAGKMEMNDNIREACKSGKPIYIDGKAYLIEADEPNLKEILSEIDYTKC